MTHVVHHIPVERLERIVREAMLNGLPVERYGSRRFIFPYTGSCTNGVGVELHARHSSRHGRKVDPIIIDLIAPCRKCEACMLRRSLMWRDRAITEFKLWPMTLFGTLTFRPELHWQADARIIGRLRAGGTDWSALTAAEQFAERSKELGDHVTKWLKVIRWGRGGKRLLKDRPRLRYLIVCEAHDGARTSDEMRGRPHFHILLHDKDNDGRLVKGNPLECILNGQDGEFIARKYRTRNGWLTGAFVVDDAPMRRAWDSGHSRFQWATDEKSASYLTKYLTKTLDARVRASQGYGDLDRLRSPKCRNGYGVTSEKTSGEKELIPKEKFQVD